jgi:hypothetical protein
MHVATTLAAMTMIVKAMANAAPSHHHAQLSRWNSSGEATPFKRSIPSGIIVSIVAANVTLSVAVWG